MYKLYSETGHEGMLTSGLQSNAAEALWQSKELD